MAVAQTDISINLFSSFKSLDSLYRRFPSNTTCLEWLSKVRWGKYVVCPHCGSIFVYKSKRGVRYHCDECNNNFTPLYGTIFQSTKLPLRKWFAAIWLTINNKKGISSAMLSRELGITQKTSWYMLQKIRQLVPQEDTKLKGEVQIDCGYIGGLLRWVNTPKTDKRNEQSNGVASRRRYLRNKVALLGLASEDRYVVKVIEEGNWKNIQPVLDNHLTKYNRVYTDLGGEFNRIGETYGCYHYRVCHEVKQWKDRKTGASTSKVEAVWASIRRHHKGIYHKLPKKRAQFYVDEFVYRYNTLKYTPQRRALDFFSRINKTISYKDIDAWTSNE